MTNSELRSAMGEAITERACAVRLLNRLTRMTERALQNETSRATFIAAVKAICDEWKDLRGGG